MKIPAKLTSNDSSQVMGMSASSWPMNRRDFDSYGMGSMAGA